VAILGVLLIAGLAIAITSIYVRLTRPTIRSDRGDGTARRR
jgi:hypothetical protein